MWLRRLLYFSYFFKNLDWKLFRKFSATVRKKHSKTMRALWWDIGLNIVKYNISILEYFQFHFYQISKKEKQQYAGTGYMYEYQLLMNPKPARKVLADKRLFYEKFKSFVKHQAISLSDAKSEPGRLAAVIRQGGKIVLKNSKGQCGVGIEIINAAGLTPDTVMHRMQQAGNDLIEIFIEQHPDLARLSDSGLNTVRIITQLDRHNKVHLLGARLRITVNSVVDNLAAGNLAAPVNMGTGRVEGPAVYSDITKEDAIIHPVTGEPIVGFVIPYWQETVELCKKAAIHDTGNKSIGWDVAVTATGPQLLEANHDWCKLLWQLPVKKGLKYKLEPYRLGTI